MVGTAAQGGGGSRRGAEVRGIDQKERRKEEAEAGSTLVRSSGWNDAIDTKRAKHEPSDLMIVQ